MANPPCPDCNTPTEFKCWPTKDETKYKWIYECPRCLGRDEGAAVAFGIIGMAEAIRAKGHLRTTTAGVDEGTDAEWCGECYPYL